MRNKQRHHTLSAPVTELHKNDCYLDTIAIHAIHI